MRAKYSLIFYIVITARGDVKNYSFELRELRGDTELPERHSERLGLVDVSKAADGVIAIAHAVMDWPR
jgi:hypothetical protein